MARKPPPPSWGCLLGMAVLLGLAFALPYLFVISVYAFPFFLGFLLLFSRWSGPPALEHVGEAQIAAAMHDLETTKIALRDEITEIKNSGAREGVRYLKGEDRFEIRSGRGQELSQALLHARSSLADVIAQIEIAQHPESRKDHAWQLAMSSWRKGRAFRWAFLAALGGFLVSAALLEAFVYQDRQVDFLVWNAFRQFLGPHVEVGSVVGWALGLATLAIARRRYRRAEELASGNSEIDDFDDILESQSDDHTDMGLECAPSEDPYLILNVSQQASVPEIKAAYRLAIVKCHPDTVADRSKSIRNAAEAEAQRVNAAYDSIRGELGFN
jgi:hypothetical protein